MELIDAKKNVSNVGFLDIEIDPTLDLFAEIEKLKKEKNAIILGHYYQDADIQDISDFIGDSLALAQKAKETDADMIVFAGVHFMAETAKILNPNKKVVLPDLKAGCSLADSCPPSEFRAFKEKYPDHVVISYINCTADIKAETDIICTSSNAKFIVESVPADKGIIFAPDRNLGAYLQKTLDREMILWDGACQVHEIFSLEKIMKLKEVYPEAKIIAHPECEKPILDVADFIGSTSQLLKFVKDSEHNEIIVVTESGILHQMKKDAPHKTLIPAPNTEETCACNDCPYMKLNTLEKIYLCMKYEMPEILMSEELRLKAKAPLDKMLEISRNAGLIK